MKITSITARATVTVFIAALGLFAVGCATSAPVEKSPWSYAGDNGPEHWSEISPECAVCAQGLEQSPIDIPADAPTNAANIVFDYLPTPLNIINNGRTIQVNYDPGSMIEVENKRYKLLQFHVHALSEHTVAGEHYDMEIHFVHQSADGEYAVVGVFLTRGAANEAYEPVRYHAPEVQGDVQTIKGVLVNAIDMLPKNKTYYRYDGSFTTPPCTEGVRWFVMTTPVELSDEQMTSLETLYDHNYRPVQPMNNRTFY